MHSIEKVKLLGLVTQISEYQSYTFATFGFIYISGSHRNDIDSLV